MSIGLYRTHRWKQTRLFQLVQEPTCRLCLELFGLTTIATVADHIEPHRGDVEKFWSNPLQSLCKPCHDSVKQQLESGGRIRGSRLDGSPIDPRHPWNKAT